MDMFMDSVKEVDQRKEDKCDQGRLQMNGYDDT